MYALVTGGSRGIGAGVALRLAADGFDVVLNFRSREDEAAAVAEQVRASTGRAAHLLAGDVSDRAAMATAMAALLETHGTPEAVVLNAGITRDTLFGMMAEDEWDQVLDVSLGSFYNVLRPLMPALMRQRRGSIVAMASVSGQVGNPGQVNYSAAKGGLIAAVKALAREVAKRKVTVNCVAPGLIATEMIADLPLDQMLAAVPMGRVGTVDEVAHAVSFLCSPGARYITGQVLGVNGGLVT